MLHEDMSGDEDDAPYQEGFEGKKRQKEGILNMEDEKDMSSASYITQSVNQHRDTYNLSQKIGMEAENKRLAETKMTQAGRMRSAFPRADFVVPRADGHVEGSSQFQKDEYDYVSHVGSNLSPSEVSGDGSDVYYANAEHTPETTGQAKRATWDKNETVMNRPRPSRDERQNASLADEKRRMQDESYGPEYPSAMRGQMKGPFPEYYDGGGYAGPHGSASDYDSSMTETYKCPSIHGGLVDCQYDQEENSGFKYPRWSTRKNRRLHRNMNGHLKSRAGDYGEQGEGLGECEGDEADASSCSASSFSSRQNRARSFELERLMKKMDYMVHLMEENEETKNSYVIEELILYCFLGFFVLFVVDSFTNVNVKYKR